MSGETPDALDYHLARRLRAWAEEIALQWAQQLRARRDARLGEATAAPVRLEQAVPLVEWIAVALETDGPAASAPAAAGLEALVQERGERGAQLDEILAELDLLGSLVGRTLVRAVREYPGPADAGSVAECVDRVRAELAEISRTATLLYQREAAERSQELSRRLEEFGHMIVHELKNPLANIQMGADMLREQLERQEGSEEARRYLGWIQRGVRRSLDLLDDVRVLAMAEGAQAETRRVPARTAVESVFVQLREAARKHDVACTIEEPLPAVEVDGVLVGVALVNLVGNAIKYADPAKPERWVRVGMRRLREGAGGWIFQVSDNGLGVPAALQHKVFHKHFRAHPGSAEGTGLGLAITQQVILQRRGRIWFESREGEGSTFSFLLPDQEVSPARDRAPRASGLPLPRS